MKLTYRTPPYDDEDDGNNDENLETEGKESRGDIDGPNHSTSQWDDDCPWAEWYSAEDPVKGIISCYNVGNTYTLAYLNAYFCYPIWNG